MIDRSDGADDNAYLPYPKAFVAAAAEGPLAGLRLAVKDVFDVAGYPTSAGNTFLLASSGVKSSSALLVDALLGAGAEFVGKTHTDELAFSVLGRNRHFGNVRNVVFPESIAGGSSSGSAAAVASGSADIGLGTDTSGSIRIPAALHALIGWRPTHGLLSAEGCRPLAPNFDTPGMIVRDVAVLTRVMEALEIDRGSAPSTVTIATDLVEHCDVQIVQRFRRTLASSGIAADEGRLLRPSAVEVGHTAYQTALHHEAWSTNADLARRRPDSIDPAILTRLRAGRRVTSEELAAARSAITFLSRDVDFALGNGRIFVFPTLPVAPPRLASTAEHFATFRQRALRINCIASLAGVPQISAPLDPSTPTGSVGFIAARGNDRALLEIVRLALTRGAETSLPERIP